MPAIFKWLLPLIILLAGVMCFSPWLRKSSKLRWLYAFASATIISPVLVIGCPGMSIKPMWLLLSPTEVGYLMFMLAAMAPLILVPLVITAVLVYFLLKVGFREKSQNNP
jgi:hypothetical protein